MIFVSPEELIALEHSGMFDEKWYSMKYQDIIPLNMTPAEHFLWIGVKLGRDPSASISNKQYRDSFPNYGNDSDFELPDEQSPFHQQDEDNSALISNISEICQKAYFSDQHYVDNYKDILDAGIDPYQHFVQSGIYEGRVGSFFDNAWYLMKHGDVKLSGVNGIDHYLDKGKDEKRKSRFIEIRSFIENEPDSYSSKEYQEWVKEYDYNGIDRDLYLSHAKSMAYKPLVSIIMPVYKVDVDLLREAILSVLNQSYSNIELCIADDCSNDKRIDDMLENMSKADSRLKYTLRYTNGNISDASNSALDLATGEFIGLIDHDDLLHPNAVFWIVEALNRDSKLDLIYTDEDKIGEDGNRYDPHFKSDFNYELFLSQNMVSHFTVYRTDIVKQIGGFRRGFEGSQDYDLTLRFVERDSVRVKHIPRVLYHWRAIEGSTALAPSEKTYTDSASIRALREHTEREGKTADVTLAPSLSHYFRVRFHVRHNPKISIIIPTKDKVDLLDQCISSINKISTYKNFEIIVVNNNSGEKKSIDYFDKISKEGIIVVNDDKSFNYSRINNLGFSYASGEHICLMNNDIEIITPDWMEEMLSFSQWKDVGCVGARLWYPDDTLQHGGVIIGLGGVAGHSHKYLKKGSAGYFGRAVLPQALSAVTAACLMIKSSIFGELNGLDEGLSVAFNDVDFCLRVREAGYRNVWTPYAEMYHHESASRGTEDTPEKQARFNGEVAFMKNRWGQNLESDPFYSPNLTLLREDFSFAKMPRLPMIKDLI